MIKSFFNIPIIAIDACIGPSAPGTIWCLNYKGLKPGEAYDRGLEFIGNTSIMVTVTDKLSKMNSVDNFRITRISSIIAKSIYDNLCKNLQSAYFLIFVLFLRQQTILTKNKNALKSILKP